MTQKPVAIITGVTRLKGIGRAICVELARQGIDVFFTFWRPYDQKMMWGVEEDEPDQIQEEILGLGVGCKKLEIDLMDEGSIATVFEKVNEHFGSASILINNATYSTMTDLDTITPVELDKHYFVNLRAPVLLTTAFVKQFENKQPGRVINLTSGQSLSAMSGEIAYALTKGAMETFTRTMQHQLAASNITINAVNPGLTDSGWLDSGWMDQRQIDVFRDRFPRGRFGLPADAARLVGFLVKEEAGWITGQVIHSEGGFIREKYDG